MGEKNKVDVLLNQLKNHKAVVVIVVVFVFISGLADMIEKIDKFISSGRSVYSIVEVLLRENDLSTVMYQIATAKKGKYEAAYEALCAHLKLESENCDFINRPMEFGDSLLAKTIDGTVVISTIDQYKIDGFVLFIDSKNGQVKLADSNFPLGVRSIKFIEDTGGSPHSLAIVKYITITGTGTFGESIRVYALDKGGVYSALDKPYSEVNSGWDAFESETVEFRTRNDLRLRNGMVEIQTTGVVIFGNNDEQFKKIPDELYLWEPRSQEFEQIEGRQTNSKALMTAIYSDFANPKGDWFEKPQSINKNLLRQVFIEEDW